MEKLSSPKSLSFCPSLSNSTNLDRVRTFRNVSIITEYFERANSYKKHCFSALAVLDAELNKQVLNNHEDLLSQVTWVEKIEGVLAVMRAHVQASSLDISSAVA